MNDSLTVFMSSASEVANHIYMALSNGQLNGISLSAAYDRATSILQEYKNNLVIDDFFLGVSYTEELPFLEYKISAFQEIIAFKAPISDFHPDVALMVQVMSE